MEIKEQLEVIKKVGTTKLSRYLGISRQAISQRIQKGVYIDEMYNKALDILNNKAEITEQNKDKEITILREIILNLNNTISKLEEENRILQIKASKSSAYIDLKKQYDELLKRYNKQNNELILLMLEHPKEKRGV